VIGGASGTSPSLASFTDLYELTMVQAYLAEGLTDTAVFTLFVRRLPRNRRFLLACGLATVVEYLEQLRFTDDDIAGLRSLGRLSDACLNWLKDFRFTGDVHAIAEGTPFFANEPILEVVAPLPQAQLIETLLMNQIHLQTLLASKAVRVVTAASGRSVVDFASRREHGIDAAVKGARAFYIAGVDATSNVLAGAQLGIPVAGTMAHSYVQAHDQEGEAFRSFARSFPGTTILVDTYDTLTGVRRVIDILQESPGARTIAAVRIDSGDIAVLAHEARRLLDAAGFQDVGIFASSNLDERAIATLLKEGAPINGFGVGTSMGVSSDAPYLDMVYKLAEYSGRGRTKLSHGKPSLPGRKQLFRYEEDGKAVADVIGQAEEHLPARPLLHPVMLNGRRTPELPTDLGAIRRRAADEIARLPRHLLDLDGSDAVYPVRVSVALESHHADVRERTRTL